MSLHKDLIFDILKLHFSEIEWDIDKRIITGSVNSINENSGFDLKLVFVNDIIKISKTSYSNYIKNKQLEGLKVNITSDIGKTYDEVFNIIKLFLKNNND